MRTRIKSRSERWAEAERMKQTESALAPAHGSAPFVNGEWVAEREVRYPTIGKVRACYYVACEAAWIFDLVVYSHTGEKIGRVSPACGGPSNFEPAIFCARYERIREPDFPLKLDAYRDYRSQLVPNDESEQPARKL